MTRPTLHWSTILLAVAVIVLAAALWFTRPDPAVRVVHVNTDRTSVLTVPPVTGCRPVNERTYSGGIVSC